MIYVHTYIIQHLSEALLSPYNYPYFSIYNVLSCLSLLSAGTTELHYHILPSICTLLTMFYSESKEVRHGTESALYT